MGAAGGGGSELSGSSSQLGAAGVAERSDPSQSVPPLAGWTGGVSANGLEAGGADGDSSASSWARNLANQSSTGLPPIADSSDSSSGSGSCAIAPPRSAPNQSV